MRISDPNPSHCSSCYGQYPQRRHIDFEAAYDGPVINTDGLRQSIDDLIICEDCMESAAKFVGYVNDEAMKREIERLKMQVETRDEMLAKQDQVIQDQEKAIRSRGILSLAQQGKPTPKAAA